MTSSNIVIDPHQASFEGRGFAYAMGRSGVTDHKVEGDGATPRGVMHVMELFYRPDRIDQPAPWAKPISPNDIWCDDPASPDYNHLTHKPSKFSHEEMYRSDHLYDMVINTSWNYPDAVPGHGSAIFLHIWRRAGSPTEGCVAFERENMLWIAQNAPIGTKIIVR